MRPRERAPHRGAEMAQASLSAASRLRGGQLPHLPPPASPVGGRVTLELAAPAGSDPEVVVTDTRRETTWRVALSPGVVGECWTAALLLPSEPALLTYHFVLADGTVIRERRQRIGIESPIYGEWEERDFQLAAYQPGTVPGWVAGSVVYQIFPDRFAIGDPGRVRQGGSVYGRKARYLSWDDRPEHPAKGRDFFGGDLQGIIDRLDYIAELGVSVIYLTPIFAARTNHRYDATDYFRIDPRLGDESVFRSLVAAAERRGLRIILDGVFNHCSKDSRYFRSAQADRTSPFYRWFTFRRWPNRYASWVRVPYLPELAECPEVEDFISGPNGVAGYWLDRGAAGWRLDVTPWLSDGYWRRFRRAVRDHRSDAYLVAEDWGDCTPRFVGDSFDAAMNYRFAYSVAGWAAGHLTPSELDDRLETLRRDTPEPTFHAQWSLLGSHDTPRLLTQVGGDRSRLRLAVAFQLAYPGVPMIYYGDEAGVEGDYAEASRAPFPWDRADASLTSFYRAAICARRARPALSHGGVATLWIDDVSNTYAILREHDGQRVVAVFNSGRIPAEITLRLGGGRGIWRDILGRISDSELSDGVLKVQLPGMTAVWLEPT